MVVLPYYECIRISPEYSGEINFILLGCIDGSLSSGQTCDGHAEGGAGDVVQTDLVAELNGGGITAVLTANTDVQLCIICAAILAGQVHQLADTGLIQLGEGIILEDLGVVIGIQELTGIITGEAIGHLSQVVGTEAEEVSILSDLVSGQACARNLDHGTDLVLQLDTEIGRASCRERV